MSKIKLQSGQYEMTVDTLGARIRSLTFSGEEIMREGNDSLQGYNGMVLAPWPNRIPEGKWSLDGVNYQLEVNEPERKNALHGFAFKTEFEVSANRDNEVTLLAELHEPTGYPFQVSLEITYRLAEHGLTCSVSATNKSSSPVPFGIAFHPYYPVEDKTQIFIPANSRMLTDEQMIPIGNQTNTHCGFEFGEIDFDDCFTDLERENGIAEMKIRSEDQEITLWQDETFDFVMVYTTNEFQAVSGSQKAIAIEAQSCPANAFNTQPPLLKPGEVFKGSWGLALGGS